MTLNVAYSFLLLNLLKQIWKVSSPIVLLCALGWEIDEQHGPGIFPLEEVLPTICIIGGDCMCRSLNTMTHGRSKSISAALFFARGHYCAITMQIYIYILWGNSTFLVTSPI